MPHAHPDKVQRSSNIHGVHTDGIVAISVLASTKQNTSAITSPGIHSQVGLTDGGEDGVGIGVGSDLKPSLHLCRRGLHDCPCEWILRLIHGVTVTVPGTDQQKMK